MLYLYSVGNSSTAIQYIRLMPALERDSNTEDNMRFSVEEVMKYKQAADTPDPKKLTTVKTKFELLYNNTVKQAEDLNYCTLTNTSKIKFVIYSATQ